MRRNLATLLLLCVTVLPACAQGERVPRVAWVLAGTAESSRGGVEAFRAGLADEGFVEGRSVLVERRFTEGRPERYAELFAELTRLPVDVLAAAGPQGIGAARDASAGRIPVAGYFCSNDVEGMVKSFARPGGNVTGVSCLSAELASKRVELLHEALPNARRIAFLYNPTIAGKDKELNETRSAAEHAGLVVVPMPASSRDGLPEAFASLRSHHIDALVISEDPLTFGNRAQIMVLAAEHRLPDISAYREFVLAGGMLSYGASLPERLRQFGRYVGRLLRGAKPADLPIEQASRFEFIVNRGAAKALGIDIPRSLLLRADEVIE